MPDLQYVVSAFQGDWSAQAWLQAGEYPEIDSATRMLNVAVREWGHLYLYDERELALRLTQAGFINIERHAWGESLLDDLRGLEARPDSRLVMEAEVP